MGDYSTAYNPAQPIVISQLYASYVEKWNAFYHNNIGTEVRLSPPMERCSDFVAWMTSFCRKILVLKAPKIATEFTVEHVNNIGSKCERILQPNHGSFLPHSMPNIECLISGLEDYVLKHEHILDKECQSCFSCREHLKAGSGAASSTDVLKDTGQMVEAVIVVAEAQKSVDMLCSRSFSPATEVLYFQDFSPCQIPWSTFEALTSIDWQGYGLTLKSNAVNGDGHATLEWDNLPPSTHIAIVLHSYNKKYPPYVTVMVSQSRKKNSAYRNVIRKAIKLALDNLKAKYMGLFLSPHALKIRGCASDLSRAIAGLISSSNDSHFQKECASTLGLCPLEVLKEGKVESCIREKIIGIIEMNDRKSKSKGGGECAPCLFECESFNEEDYPGEDNEEVEEDSFQFDSKLPMEYCGEWLHVFSQKQSITARGIQKVVDVLVHLHVRVQRSREERSDCCDSYDGWMDNW
ncbi:hypothetical protein QJS10_CPA03g00372 [Acorus calamus]|uniref:Uncharacterized protein n=1 Tax=Acorus calamus TaxID=4465 RepID=A0AAV9F6W6_ACOCL|nr:hypothetical protein QJS10_CPA03g00372 [Acorus calamus]